MFGYRPAIMRGNEQARADSAAVAIERIAAIDAVPTILEAACRLTGMGFAAIARVTETEWVACAVRDEIAFGLAVGGQLELTTTICNEIRQHGQPVVIDNVETDKAYRDHPTPRFYGFKSYISIPIKLADGRFFGTLCAIDPDAARVSDPATQKTFELFAKLVAREIDTQEQLTQSHSALADERASARLRDQFIAVLGHDLRNPLASLDAGVRLLSKESLAERPRQILRKMLSSSERMAGLINNVLDFARGQLGGGLPVEIADNVDVATLLNAIVDELHLSNPDRKIKTSIDLAEPVACDPARIGQLISNLIANALAHGDPVDSVRVAMRSGGGSFGLSVANSGKPIPPEIRDKLFEPFFRPALAAPQQGLGLGLYIVAEIARAHRGDLSVSSDDAETRFELTMPAVRLVA